MPCLPYYQYLHLTHKSLIIYPQSVKIFFLHQLVKLRKLLIHIQVVAYVAIEGGKSKTDQYKLYR